ncbi:hypothetical protein PYJP_15620 [Pyrofollis japonicus]|nr:hypothetical protein PYJP_15620 [Pyrofollis japonicus]
MSKARTAILIYTIIGVVLMLISLLELYGLFVRGFANASISSYVLVGILLFVLFIGLHWTIVGIASLRSRD